MITPRIIQRLCRHARWSLPLGMYRWCCICGAQGIFHKLKETR